MHGGSLGQPGRTEVAADRVDRERFPVHEQRPRRATRQCLDREGAAARVPVEHVCADDPRGTERSEERLLDPVGGRTRARAFGRAEAEPARLARDHPRPPSARPRSTGTAHGCRWCQASRSVSGIDALALFDELQAIARNGLTYSENPYDRERYERLLDLATRGYGEALSLPPEDVRSRLAGDLGYVTAKVGADAAIFDEQDRILLVHRADDGRWGLVSGWVDAGETPADTVVREVGEEVGLVATVLGLVDVIGRPAGSGYGPHGVVAVVYRCSVAPGEIRCSHEVREARYRAIDEVRDWHHNHERLARTALSAHLAARGAVSS